LYSHGCSQSTPRFWYRPKNEIFQRPTREGSKSDERPATNGHAILGALDMTRPMSRPGKFDPLRQLLESVKNYAIYTLDLKGFILTWNVGARQLNGFAAEEAIGQHFSRFFTPEDNENGWQVNVLSQAARDEHLEKNGWCVRKDGSRFPVQS